MFLTERVPWIQALPVADRKLLVLAGMAAALGGLFSSPMLSVLMVFELGKAPKYVSFHDSLLPSFVVS